MPRVQVYLTEELKAQLTELGVSPSELLQQAIRDEGRRQALAAATDTYLSELAAEVGAPSDEDVEYARRFVADLHADPIAQAG